MLLISVKREELPKLHTSGVAVRINGKPETLKRDGDYLTYEGNRCKILSARDEGSLLAFTCASDGDENEPHVIVSPNGEVTTFNCEVE